MEEGRKLREEREKELRRREEDALKAAAEDEPPELGAYGLTGNLQPFLIVVKETWTLPSA